MKKISITVRFLSILKSNQAEDLAFLKVEILMMQLDKIWSNRL